MKSDPFRCSLTLVLLGFFVCSFAPLHTVAAISCYENADGTWTCSGGQEVPPGVIVNPDGSSTCTNCVNMTPAQCEAVKNEIKNACDSILFDIDQVSGSFDYIQAQLNYLKRQWSAFPDCPQMPNLGISRDAFNAQVVYFQQLQSLYSSYTSVYLDFVIPTDTSDLAAFRTACEAILVSFGSIRATTSYNPAFLCEFLFAYYHGVYQFVQVYLSQIDEMLSGLSGTMSYINSSWAGVANIRDSSLRKVVCSNCVLSASSGSGSGSGTGGSSSDNFCPECLKVILQEISQKITVIDQKLVAQKLTLDSQLQISTQSRNYLEELVEKFKDFSEKFDIYSSNLTNLVLRIDDYLEEDQKINLNAIRQAVIVLSNDVDTVQKQFFTQAIRSFTFETPEKTSPNVLSEDTFILGTVTNMFNSFPNNESLYKRYDWFSRIEMLLIKIAGVDAAADFEQTSISEAKSQLSTLSNRLVSVQSSFDSSSDKILDVKDGILQAVTNIKNIIPTTSSPVNDVIIFEADIFPGISQDLDMFIDTRIQTLLRVIFSVIWVGFSVLIAFLLFRSFLSVTLELIERIYKLFFGSMS